VKTHTNYLTFNTKKRQEIIDITDEVEKCRAAAGINEGMVLVSAMHISASVFVNDHEPGLWKDILDWLENRIAPWSPDDYRHNSGTGEDNAAAHLRSLTIGHEVIVPVTKGRLDFGPWQRVFYGAFCSRRWASNVGLFDRFLCAAEADLAVGAVAKGLHHRAAAAAQRDPGVSFGRNLPPSLRNGNRIPFVIDEIHIAAHSIRAVPANLDRDV